MRVPYTYRFDDVDADTTYVGKATALSSETDPVWRISLWKRVGTETKITYAGEGWNFAWTDRLSLTYM